MTLSSNAGSSARLLVCSCARPGCPGRPPSPYTCLRGRSNLFPSGGVLFSTPASALSALERFPCRPRRLLERKLSCAFVLTMPIRCCLLASPGLLRSLLQLSDCHLHRRPISNLLARPATAERETLSFQPSYPLLHLRHTEWMPSASQSCLYHIQ